MGCAFSRWREHKFRCGRKTRTKSQTSIIAQKKGGPRRRPTKLEAAAINRYFAGIRFIWRSVFPVGITNLAGTPFFRKRGAGCIKKGAGAPFFLKKGTIAPFLREIGFPAKKIIPKCTDRDFLRYRYGKYREILTDTDRKIPIRYTTLVRTAQRRGRGCRCIYDRDHVYRKEGP